MARVWTDGFELGGLRGYLFTSASSSNLAAYGGSRSLGISLGSVTLALEALSEGYMRVAARWPSATAGYLLFETTGGDMVFRVFRNNTTGVVTLETNVNLGTADLTTNHADWYVVEVYWLIAEAGKIEVRIDGNDAITYEGDTRYLSRTEVGRLKLGANGSYYDDLAINDTTGAADNSWCGPGKVYYMPAASDDSTQWTPSAGDDNYAMVDETPHDSDTTYIQTATNGHTDVYGLGTPPAAMEGKIIQRVWPEAVCRKTEAEEGLGISLGITIGATTDDGPEEATGVEYGSNRIIGDEYTTNIDTTEAWSFSVLADIKVRLIANVDDIS